MSTNIVKDGAVVAVAIMRANDLTNLGLLNGAMKGNEDDAADAAKSPANSDAVAIPALSFAELDRTVS